MTDIAYKVKLVFPENLNAYFSNFISMGIFEIPFGYSKADDRIYNNILSCNNLLDYKNIYKNDKLYSEISLAKGFFNITQYGKLFIKACNIEK